MRNYENLVIVKPTFTAEEINASIKAVEEVITSNGGEIAATSPMGMRKLAYPINKSERGYFHVIYYSIAPAAISEIERRFRINEDLLRFVTIKYDTNREIAAFDGLVAKAKKASEAKAVAAAAPVAEEAPVVEAPAVEVEAPAEAEAKTTEAAAKTTEAAAE
jgi:small subunit ribosomal protein S6